MKTFLQRGAIAALVVAAFTIPMSGCAVSGGAYDDGYGGGVGVGIDYYEPYGGFYGGWAPGYHVAPYRGHDHGGYGGGHGGSHAYRPAPASHSMPSLPSHTRAPGSRRQR